MDSSKIKAIMFAVVALFAALYLGIAAATAQLETIAWVVAGVTLVTCLLMGRKIWLLIPFLGSVNIALSVPTRPDTLLVAQILVIGFSTLLFLTRRLPFHLRLTELEFWMFMIILLIVQVYLRNPTSMSIFGGSSVGGRPYVVFAITAVATILLSGLHVAEAEMRTALRLSILGGLTNLGISILGRISPTIGYWTGTNFAIATENDYTNAGQAVDEGAATREGSFMTAATNISLWVSSFRSPFTACFHPLWAPLILLSIAFAALSGYRSAIALVGFTYLIGICYRGGFIQVFLAGMAGVLGVALLAIVNLTTPLPPNMQRSLSFLPGTWEKRYLHDTEGSTDWRVEIWKEALGSDRWIKNKLLGDGLGFTAKELEYQANLAAGKRTATGMSGLDNTHEAILASGDYHSVFVSSVRTVGYIGFVIYFLAIIRIAIHAHRLIQRYRHTTHFSTCLFFGIPAILSPFWLPFSASNFLMVASGSLGSIAMLRMLQTNLQEVELPVPHTALPRPAGARALASPRRVGT